MYIYIYIFSSYSTTLPQCLERHLNTRHVVFISACEIFNTTSWIWRQRVFEVFYKMILTDTWQPITRFGGHCTNTENFTPPSVLLTFMLASGKCIEACFYLTNSSATCLSISCESMKTDSAESWPLKFHCYFLYHRYFKILATLEQTSSKESCLWEISWDTYCITSSAAQH